MLVLKNCSNIFLWKRNHNISLKFVRNIITNGSLNSLPVPLIQTCISPLFPHFEQTQHIENNELVQLIKNQIRDNRPFAAVFMKCTSDNNLVASTKDLWQIGTLAHIKWISNEYESAQIHLTGLDRVKLLQSIPVDNCNAILMAEIEKFTLVDYEKDKCFDAMTMRIVSAIKDAIEIDLDAAKLFLNGISKNRENFHNVEFLCDLAATIAKPGNDKLKIILQEADIRRRMEFSLELLQIEKESKELNETISQQARNKIIQRQNKSLLIEQMNVVKSEMGVKTNKEIFIEKCSKNIQRKTLPAHIAHIVNDNLCNLKKMNVNNLEYNIVSGYLNWLTQLPWNKYSKDNLNIITAKSILDTLHFGMDDVKTRILELIAVANLKGGLKGKIICLHGPSGVGKTSVAKSIASALNRKFYRINVGGMMHAAELKGHRRTYSNAMPGKIVQCLKISETLNPLILIDEVDKIGSNVGHGIGDNAASALLEILDPEQNGKFLDYYLDIDIDLSNILFICTANNLYEVSEPLLDRMELISMNGYSSEEKFFIAKAFLLPKILKQSGIDDRLLNLTDLSLKKIIASYCHEAGLRNLENQLEKIVRNVALQICMEKTTPLIEITEKNVREYLGNAKEKTHVIDSKQPPGIVTGLAYTEDGGDIFFIETVKTTNNHYNQFDNDTSLKLTGQLGPILCDSAEISLTFARNFIQTIDSRNVFLENSEIHLHVPKLNIPKEGNSAGIAITTALLSLALQTSVPSNIAMTGAISLYGKILPVGGVKEKIMAAKRNGINRIILPQCNRDDYESISQLITHDLRVFFVNDYEEVFKMIFS